jgi:hypothetical protein
MRPPLIALDFAAGTARRYWPKPDKGFLTQTAKMQKEPDVPWMMGSPEGLALLEGFRKGELQVQPLNEDEPEVA